MKENKKRAVRLLILVGLMALAGFFYCAGRGRETASDGRLVISGLEETGNQETAVKTGGEAENNNQENNKTENSKTENSKTENSKTENSSADSGSSAAVQQASVAPEPELCYVHVSGAVRSPGVYELSEGSRVFQAVEAAGGFLEEADEAWLNLAEVVMDGMKITVYTKEETSQLLTSGNGRISQVTAAGMQQTGGLSGGQSNLGGPSSTSGLVNINTADKAMLMTLKGIGESRAESILTYRQQYGAFENPEDIMKVSGIKEAAYEKIKDSITTR